MLHFCATPLRESMRARIVRCVGKTYSISVQRFSNYAQNPYTPTKPIDKDKKRYVLIIGGENQ